MSDIKAVRAALERADRFRATERNAESARTKIRLSGQPVARRGLLGFLRGCVWEDQALTQAETNAVYDALAIVRDEAQRRADEIEATVAKGPR